MQPCAPYCNLCCAYRAYHKLCTPALSGLPLEYLTATTRARFPGKPKNQKERAKEKWGEGKQGDLWGGCLLCHERGLASCATLHSPSYHHSSPYLSASSFIPSLNLTFSNLTSPWSETPKKPRYEFHENL